jgi:hypothetical protein
MNAPLEAPAEMPDAIADMNGPLAYWGPAARPTAAGTQPRRTQPAPEAAETGLIRLARTLNGRTWTGTSTLMSLAVGMPVAA